MTKKFKKISRLSEFSSDMRKLCKRYRTLNEDLDNFIETALYAYHKLGLPIGGIHREPGLRIDRPIYKATSFACRSLKGKGKRSGIRVIYTYYQRRDEIELIEIYYKGDKALEDRDRILRHYK
jgi:hypothetical protein